jgi:trimeric autotransporter adhesin
MKRLALFIFFISSVLHATAQNVGIGTDVPLYKLHVATSTGGGLILQNTSPHTPGLRTEMRMASATIGIGAINTVATGSNYGDLRFLTGINSSLQDRVTIRHNGAVGINTISPTAMLEVNGTGGFVDGAIKINGSQNASHFYYGTNEDTYIRGGKANSLVVISDHAGNVGIGSSTNVNSKLTVTTPYGVSGIEHTNGDMRLLSFAGLNTNNAYFGTFTNHALYIVSNNIIGCSFYRGMFAAGSDNLAAFPIHVYQNFGNAFAISNFEVTRTWDWSHGNSGPTPILLYSYNGAFKSAIRSDDGSYYTISDRTTKKDITGMETVLSKVMQLKPSHYVMKGATSSRIGFVSQEVEPIFPELVTPLEAEADSNGHRKPTVLAINYSGFSVIAIKAIQEQQQQIDQLKLEIDRLKSLEQRIIALEKK